MTKTSRDRLRGSLRLRLVMLSLAVLAPALLSTGLLLWSAYAHERSALERQLGERARSLSLVVDRQLGQYRVMVQTLSASSSLRSGDWKAFDALARRATLGADIWIVVGDMTGRQIVNTRLPLGARLPHRPRGMSLASAPDPRTGIFVSNLFYGPAAKAPVVVVGRRVTLDDGRQVEVQVCSRAKAFDDMWRDQGLSRNWTGVVTDAKNAIVTRSRDTDDYVGRVASQSMARQIADRRDGVAETVTLDGIKSITAWSRAPGYGWTAILAAPRDEIVGAARASLYLAAIAGLLLLALGVALALWMARAILLPVERLTDAAQGLEHGGRLGPPEPSGITELDELGEALSRAANRLAANQVQLQELNASLEDRVAERSRELEGATESLVQARKLEAIGRLTGGVAHDFNNLLMAISGNLDLLKRKTTDEALLAYVGRARQAAERGAKLTAQLLAFSRKQRLQPRVLDVNDAISEAGALLTPTLGGGVRVETVLDPGLWPALADPTQLELVILNLAINARDAMPMGGAISIETSNVVRRDASERPEAPPAGEFVMVAVADTGVGMAPEVAERVFEPFFTTKEVGQGSGLGLPQVLGLAKQLGGGVEIVTALDVGTTVKVFLPRAHNAVETPLEQAAEPGPQDLSGLRILVVDDDPDVRNVTVALLTDLGCRVTEAASGLAAVRVAESGAVFDAALLDFAMPGMNGLEAAGAIMAAHPTLPVLIMSGFAESEALAGRWRGPLLHKPFTTANLAVQIFAAASGAGGAPLRLVT